MLSVIINNEEHQIESIGDFDTLLSGVEQTDNLEIWISHDSKQSLTALLNKNCGWLMYLRFPEDVGFSSRKPDRGELISETEAFLLGNGQSDSYPKSWTLDRSKVFIAISEFANSSNLPKTITWHDDATN